MLEIEVLVFLRPKKQVRVRRSPRGPFHQKGAHSQAERMFSHKIRMQKSSVFVNALYKSARTRRSVVQKRRLRGKPPEHKVRALCAPMCTLQLFVEVKRRFFVKPNVLPRRNAHFRACTCENVYLAEAKHAFSKTRSLTAKGAMQKTRSCCTTR